MADIFGDGLHGLPAWGAEYCPKSDGVFDFIITVFPPKL